MRSACPPTRRRWTRAADVLRDLVLRTPPNAGGGLLEFAEGRRHRPAGAAARSRRQAASARPLHQERRRLSRRLVRERRRQGRVRLRWHRRQLRRALDAGYRLRAAASLLRRGERQARRLGPCRRRHGRDHAGDGEGGASARRAHPHGRCRLRGCSPGTARCAAWCSIAARRSPPAPSPPTFRPSCCSAISCPTAAVAPELRDALRRDQVRLRHVPHERGAGRASRFHLPARQGAAGPPRLRHHHRPDARLSGARLSRRAPRRLVGRARSSRC